MAGKTLAVTDADFDATVLKADKPALVDFWAVWCGPCKAIAPVIEELATEFDGRAVVAKVDVDGNHQIATRYGISAIPTLLLFKDGKVVDRVVGRTDRKTLAAKLQAIL